MLVDAITLSVSDNPEMRVVTLLPTDEANSVNKMRKVIAAFRNGAFPRPSGVQVRRKRDISAAKWAIR
jgi:hypothetical protein